MTIDVLWYGIGLIAVWLAAMRLRSIRARQLLYLFASWLFYFSWGSWLIVILIFSSLMNYALGEWLKKRITAGRLWTGIALNLILLSIFKYLPLLGEVAPGPLGFLKRIVFPLGVSFWTFEALSYLLELYREEELNPTLVEFCLYMAFWPTVLQGPICRMSSMLPQFRQNWSVTEDDLKTGVRRIAIGALMLVLAGVMGGGLYAGAGVEAIFDNTAARLGGTDVWFVIVAYGFQLYFSFCGYSHLVIGAARLFGIQLHENFDRPYLSTTPSVFWTRWHMSPSFWIRDFIFLPLATARREVWWRNLSLVNVSTRTFRSRSDHVCSFLGYERAVILRGVRDFGWWRSALRLRSGQAFERCDKAFFLEKALAPRSLPLIFPQTVSATNKPCH